MSFSAAEKVLGSYNGEHSTNAVQELPKLLSTREEAEAYSKFFLRTFKGKKHPDVMGLVLDTCGVVKVSGGYRVLVSAYWREDK